MKQMQVIVETNEIVILILLRKKHMCSNKWIIIIEK